MTVTDLRNAERAYQTALARSEDRRIARNALIAQALADGWTHAQIAEATGMSRARVGQLALR